MSLLVLFNPPPASPSSSWITKSLKAYIGGVWTAKPLKAYVGGTWVTKMLKAYIGGIFTVNTKIAEVVPDLTASYLLYGADFQAMYQSFHGQGKLRKAIFNIAKTGTPTGNVYAKLYPHVGPFGTSSAPNTDDTPFAISDAISAASLSTTIGAVEFTFSGSAQYNMTSALDYCIAICYNGGDASNGVVVSANNTDTGIGNPGYTYSESTWTAVSSQDLAMQVWADIEVGADEFSLTYTTRANADASSGGDASVLSNWNTKFNLPTNGTLFTSVTVVGGKVTFTGGGGMTVKASCFMDSTSLLEVNDTAGIIVAVNDYAFANIKVLTSVNLAGVLTMGSAFYYATAMTNFNAPKLTSAGLYCFDNCISMTSFNLPELTNCGDMCFYGNSLCADYYLPKLTTSGTTTGSNSTFYSPDFSGSYHFTIPASLMTCNGGNPDGDLIDIINNYTCLITQIGISVTHLSHNGAQNQITGTTDSFSPVANRLYLFTVTNRTNVSVDPVQPTVTGCGLTWVAVGSVVYDTTSTSRRRVTQFRAMGSSPTTGYLTMSFGSETQTNFGWILDELNNVDTSGSNGSGAIIQSVTAVDSSEAVSTLTATLETFSDINNATYGSCATGTFITNPPTVTTDFNIIYSYCFDGGTTCQTLFKNSNDTTIDISYSEVNSIGIIAIELKAKTN
jgi:hypothetical protein